MLGAMAQCSCCCVAEYQIEFFPCARHERDQVRTGDLTRQLLKFTARERFEHKRTPERTYQSQR